MSFITERREYRRFGKSRGKVRRVAMVFKIVHLQYLANVRCVSFYSVDEKM